MAKACIPATLDMPHVWKPLSDSPKTGGLFSKSTNSCRLYVDAPHIMRGCKSTVHTVTSPSEIRAIREREHGPVYAEPVKKPGKNARKRAARKAAAK